MYEFKNQVIFLTCRWFLTRDFTLTCNPDISYCFYFKLPKKNMSPEENKAKNTEPYIYLDHTNIGGIEQEIVRMRI